MKGDGEKAEICGSAQRASRREDLVAADIVDEGVGCFCGCVDQQYH